MKVEWAPLHVPLHRRLETLAAAIWIFSLVIGESLLLLLYIGLLLFGNLYIRTFCLLYLVYIYIDRKSGDNGGKGWGSQWFKNLSIWKHYRNYFPVSMVKTADLSPDRNYLFAIFPHGILSSGAFSNFATNASNWRELYPGIRSKPITLSMHFHIPFFRELVFAWGTGAASANSIRTLLTASNDPKDPANADGLTSNAVIVVVGGAQEALNSRPNNYQIVIKKRKGFIKLALSTGSPIVPVFSFGEVDIFEQPPNPPGSTIRRFQDKFKELTGMAPAVFIGRGFFQYSYGIIPKRRAITTVVGSPLEVAKNENPTPEEVEELHAKFVVALTELFETHKPKYIPNASEVKLIME